MRRPMPSEYQMHLWQQCSILCVLTEQIRVWNGATNLPHTLSFTPVLIVIISSIPRAVVRIEVGGRTIISGWYQRTAWIVSAQDRAASFKSRQVRLECALSVVPIEVLSGQWTAEEDRSRMIATAIGPERLVGNAVKAEVGVSAPRHFDKR